MHLCTMGLWHRSRWAPVTLDTCVWASFCSCVPEATEWALLFMQKRQKHVTCPFVLSLSECAIPVGSRNEDFPGKEE